MSNECTSCGSLLPRESRTCQACIDEREELGAELALLRELEAWVRARDFDSRIAPPLLAKLDELRAQPASPRSPQEG